MLVAKTCMAADFGVSMLNYWRKIYLPTCKQLAGRSEQHPWGFVGCVGAGWMAELTWRCAGEVGECKG